jgi:hypothetical protein
MGKLSLLPIIGKKNCSNTEIKMGTPDKIRAKNYRERKKQREAAAVTEAIEACKTEREWWEKNRSELDVEKLGQLQDRHEEILARLDWMEEGYLLDPSDPCFVSISDGVDLLVDDLSKGGCPHLGYVKRNHQDIPSDWSTGIWSGKKYWHDPGLLKMLYAESPATELYVKYGFLSNLPDWTIVKFLRDIAKWDWDKAASLVGYFVPDYKASRDATVCYK